MKLTVESARDQGLLPVAVYDANGRHLTGALVEIDTVTGVVRQQKLNEEGRPMFECGHVIFEEVQHPAPLTWKSLRRFSG